jgi:hypothetical protein
MALLLISTTAVVRMNEREREREYRRLLDEKERYRFRRNVKNNNNSKEERQNFFVTDDDVVKKRSLVDVCFLRK